MIKCLSSTCYHIMHYFCFFKIDNSLGFFLCLKINTCTYTCICLCESILYFYLPEFDQTENGTLSKILVEGKTH